MANIDPVNPAGDATNLKSRVKSCRVAIAVVALVTGAVIVGNAAACNIPVFRYALERWKPDSCEVLVFYDGDLTAEQSAIVDRLSSQTGEASGHANATVIRIDLASQNQTDQKRDDQNAERVGLWTALKESEKVTLPYAVVRTKLGRGKMINHWHGSLDAADRIGLFDSPVRRETRDRLLAGHSVVWLLVGSSDAEKTADAKQLARQTFKTLEGKVKLPEGIGLPGSELYADIPLVLKYSLLQVEGDDPKEAFLLSLLTGLRKTDFEQGEPLFVPVFGRGRALEVIPARDMTPRLMQELTVFLSGACSCQVKEQNPGFDLLINADWDGRLFGDPENRPPDRSAEEGRYRDSVLVPIPPGRK